MSVRFRMSPQAWHERILVAVIVERQPPHGIESSHPDRSSAWSSVESARAPPANGPRVVTEERPSAEPVVAPSEGMPADDTASSRATPPPAAGRRHAIIALVATIAILIAVPIIVVTYRPSWHLRPIEFGSPGEDLAPKGWSPDGTRFLFAQTDRFVVVRVADGARVATGYGSWPVWVDDDTVDALQDTGLGRSQIVRIGLAGRITYVPLPLAFETPKLIGEGPLEIAATENIGSIWAAVVDPRTGREIAHLPDVRAIAWAARGTLITKTSGPFPIFGTLPGHLRVWTARDGLRSIGGELYEIADQVSASPSGDAIVCKCAVATDDPRTEGSIYVVPLDGSAPRKLFDVTRNDMSIQTNFGWLPDGSLIVLDGVGFHRFKLDGTPLPVPTIPTTDLPAPKHGGNPYVLGGELVLGSQRESGASPEGRLTIRGLDDEVMFGRTFPSSSGVRLVIDHDRPRALAVTSPQQSGEAPEALFILERL